jgi:hypothetical protein
MEKIFDLPALIKPAQIKMAGAFFADFIKRLKIGLNRMVVHLMLTNTIGMAKYIWSGEGNMTA